MNRSQKTQNEQNPKGEKEERILANRKFVLSVVLPRILECAEARPFD